MNTPVRKELPSWLLPVVVVLGILILGGVAWKGLNGSNAPTGPSIAVHPGMVDVRAEAQKGNVNSARAEADEDDKDEKKGAASGKPSSKPGEPKAKSTEPDGDNDGDKK